MDPDEIIASHRSYYGSYHNHKETMAYGGATLYIGAATAVILKSRELLEVQPRCVVSVLLVLGFFLGHAFVMWQLANREEAANMVRAATTVLSRLRLPNSPPPDMTPTRWYDVELPRVLVDEVNRTAGRSPFLGGARAASVLTVLVMLAWSAVAVWALAS